MRRQDAKSAFEKISPFHSSRMGEMKTYAGPDTYGATDAENQNNALAMGADNSINDPNWKLRKTAIKEFVPSKKTKGPKKIKVAKSYPE